MTVRVRGAAMQVGIVFSQADSGVDPVAIRQFATQAEAAGFDHLMAYDHILGASADSFQGPIGSFPTAPYTEKHSFHEILTLFSHLAAVTTTLEFATSVLVLPQRQTAVAAKQIATVNLLSSDRLHVAVGVGWNWVEYSALGTAFETRSKRLSEQMQVMRRLWTEPLVTFDGEFHRLDRVGINPLPGKAFPIWMGTGAADSALKRVVADADGWMPLVIPGLDPIDIATGVRRLRQLAEDAGRDPASLPVWGRVYLGPGWQSVVEEGVELGFTHLSVGFNRMANPGAPHAKHLEDIIEAKAEVDRIVR
jgi:probable F420-dependent oxidoreductase